MLWLWFTLGAVALLFASVAYTRFRVARAHRRHPPEGDFVEVDGVRTHVVRRGTGPPMLFLHGLAGLHQDIEPVAEQVAGSFEVIALDRPGYGYTTRPRAELSDPRVQADWLASLLDALGIQAPLVVAHSWGGALALTLAVRHPGRVAGLVLVAPYAYPRTEPDDWIHRFPRLPLLRSLLGHTLVAPGGRLLAPRFVSASFTPEPIDPAYHELWLDMVLRPGQFDTTLEEVRTVDPALATVHPRYPEIQLPVVVVTGDRDVSVDHRRNAAALAEALGQAELVVLPGAGHMVPWLHAGVVAQAIERAWEQAEGPGWSEPEASGTNT